ncbi:MAG TPA: hypothetical protein GX529_09335 [Firmicutes bacterium]|nr:hypothetical protein [Candidatus Fermentithermobacillaceae bacterium]
MKRQLPILIVAATAIFVMAMKFVNFGPAGAAAIKEADVWIQVTYEFAFLLGAINFVRLHYGNVSRQRPKWIYSVVSLVALVLTCLVTLIDGVNGTIAMFLYQNIANRIDSAIYALLGFYVCSAAYRSFKLKNLEAGILLASAVLLMLAQAPIGDAIFPGMSKWGEWILNVPNSAGMRGIRLGAGIGAYAASIRVILGLERSWTGSGT